MSETRPQGKAALARLEQRIKSIGRLRVRFTAIALCVVASWYVVLILLLRDIAKANLIFSNSFQYMIVAWTCWFMYPYFLRMEAKQDLSISMGHDSVDVLEKLDKAVDQRLKRVDGLLSYVEGAVERDILKSVEDHLGAIRRKIDREVPTLPVVRRPPESTADPNIPIPFRTAPDLEPAQRELIDDFGSMIHLDARENGAKVDG